MKIILCVFTTIVSVSTGFAQLGSFNIVNVKYHLNPKWFFTAEGQVRSLGFYNDFHYHEFTFGPSWKVLPSMTLTLVAGKYDTYSKGGNFVSPRQSDEIRLWPQITLHQSIGSIKVDQRYRLENRFTQNGYAPRFRYRLALQYPFGKERNGLKPFQLAVSNELFFFNKSPYFQRNRFSATMQYKFSPTLSVQSGWVNQFDYKINDETGTNFFQVGLFLDFYRKEKSRDDADDLF
jgi:hypothetical protein